MSLLRYLCRRVIRPADSPCSAGVWLGPGSFRQHLEGVSDPGLRKRTWKDSHSLTFTRALSLAWFLSFYFLPLGISLTLSHFSLSLFIPCFFLTSVYNRILISCVFSPESAAWLVGQKWNVLSCMWGSDVFRNRRTGDLLIACCFHSVWFKSVIMIEVGKRNKKTGQLQQLSGKDEV